MTAKSGKATVRIGCWSAFWGDSSTGAHQLARNGNLDYLVGDYLAEVTMGILARQKAKEASSSSERGTGGFVSEFAKSVWRPLMKDLVAKNIRVVTNAGGLDPLALKRMLEEISRDGDFPTPPKIAAVYGDDVLPVLNPTQSPHEAAAAAQKKTKTGSSGLEVLPFELLGQAEEIRSGKRLLSANAYFGALPIAEALASGAHVVVTGRTADSALVLGPLMYEFGWSASDYDRLAAGSVAGHLIECATQATGGNFTDWRDSAFSPHGGWANMGFPIVEVEASGVFKLTKPPNTGGLVTRATVGEQLLYEIGDPRLYVLPDVTVDFSNVTLRQTGTDEVLVEGVRGRPPTDCYKVSATYVSGYKLAAELFIAGEDAREKALEVGKAILTRSRRLLKHFGMDDFIATNVEVLGSEHMFGRQSTMAQSREVTLRIVVHHTSPLALRAFGSEVAPAATSMAPGITGGGSGRPYPQPLLVHCSFLVPKSAFPSFVVVGNEEHEVRLTVPDDHLPANPPQDLTLGDDYATAPDDSSLQSVGHGSPSVRTVPLITLCWGRSGDKGDMANIGIMVRRPEFFAVVKQFLTASRVFTFFRHLIAEGGVVKRYELPGIQALNFLLTNSLGGGGLSSLNVDRQGKSYAQLLLTLQIPVPADLLPPASKL